VPTDVILEPSFVADLGALPFDELRRRRDLVEEVETGMSYLRRLLQGRPAGLVAKPRATFPISSIVSRPSSATMSTPPVWAA
jgi:hypothetical protein